MWQTRHLLLRHRKAIAGRLLYFEALEPLLLKIRTAGADAEEKRLQAHLRSYTEEVIDASTDEEPLDEFLVRLAARLEHHAKYALEGQFGDLFSRLVSSLNAGAGALVCRACSPLRRVCDGGDDDHEIVGRAGHCIREVKALFTAAISVAEAYYNEYATAFPPTSCPQVYFWTVYSPCKPHRPPVSG